MPKETSTAGTSAPAAATEPPPRDTSETDAQIASQVLLLQADQIYQFLWNLDQNESGSGVKPVLNEESARTAGRPSVFLKIDEDQKCSGTIYWNREIPKTFGLVQKLFDNYVLDEYEPEEWTVEELAEIDELLEAVIETSVMKAAFQFIKKSGQNYMTSKWKMKAFLFKTWFESFQQGEKPDLSGFEHVFVGEQGGNKVQGHHFWMKFLNDRDNIVKLLDKAQQGQQTVPETVTIGYKWVLPDGTEITKKTGGFFVGCSPECLLAMGTVAFCCNHNDLEFQLGQGNYTMKVFVGGNHHLRTFYPMLHD